MTLGDAPNRTDLARAFLAKSDWRGADIRLLAGDASNRTYYRVTPARGTPAVLMDSPPDKGEDVRPFLAIARHLSDQGLSAPNVFDGDIEKGFLLLEDLGDAIFARVLDTEPGLENSLYAAATDMLHALHDAPLPVDVAPYDTVTMAPLAGLAAEWYASEDTNRAALESACARALDAAPASAPVLVLRDFHAENLIWLPERDGLRRVGLLDFQDARIGHDGYDLASLLRDARRDVSAPVQKAMVARMAGRQGVAPAEVELGLVAQGAQRNLRILGVFARLSLHFGKAHYIDLIPRVWSNLMTELSHPALSDLRATVEATLPPPTAAHLQDLKDRCGTIPKLA